MANHLNHERGQFTLTPGQRDLLRTAMDAGYFSILRETTLCELVDRLEISDVVASRRLRRGCSDLVTEAVHQSTAEE